MTALMESVSGLAAAWGPSLVAKATVLLLLMLLVVRLARQSRASVRHLWLTAGFAVLLVLPFAPALVPPVRIEVTPMPALLAEAFKRSTVIDATVARAVESSASDAPVPDRRWPPTMAGMLTTLWLAGFVLFALPLAVGVVQVGRLRRSARPWHERQWLVDALARGAGVRRRVEVMSHDRIAAPATCGVCRPAILFPIDARTWSDEDLVRAAVHEIEHVRRADCLVSTVARLTCALYWFHPLAWIAWRRLGLEAESACDDAVVPLGDATLYADQLVTLAGRMAAKPRHPLLAISGCGDLAHRVAAVLAPRQARGRVGHVSGAAILAVASVIMMAIAPLQAVRGQQEPPTATWSDAFEVASVRPNTSDFGLVATVRMPGGRVDAVNISQLQELAAPAGCRAGGTAAVTVWVRGARFHCNHEPRDDRAPLLNGTSSPLPLAPHRE